MKSLWVLAIMAILVTGCNHETREQRIQKALDNLLAKSPADRARLYDVRDIKIEWKLGALSGTTLAATTVKTDGTASIVFDYDEIQKDREYLEPVIAHELDHIHDAYVKYGINKFIEISDSERSLAWKDRTLEKQALSQENETRAFLLKNYPQEFSRMTPTRSVK